MIVVVCKTCNLGLRVMGDEREIEHLVGTKSDFWPDRYPCTRCDGRALGFVEAALSGSELGSLELLDLSAEELFAALNGLGLPKEQVCTKDVVETLLKEQPIRRVIGADVAGTQRFCLEQLELWDGTRLYFGAAPEGSIVYRVVRPHSYAAQVLRG